MPKIINLQTRLDSARQETIAMMQQGIDISDSSLVTPLEAIANQYPEIAAECNQLLMELVREPINLINQQLHHELINEF